MSAAKSKNNKKVFSYTENQIYNLNVEDDEDDFINMEISNQEYYLDTVQIIRKNILEYVEDNYLPLCEYLCLKDIKTLLIKSNNF